MSIDFSKKIVNKNSMTTCYQLSAPHREIEVQLDTNISCDVCIIGGGLVGLSTAIQLSERGLTVALLESTSIGNSPSGSNGGQVLPGFACSQNKLESLVGREDACTLWNLSVDAIKKINQTVQDYNINCDWTLGTYQAASKPQHMEQLKKKFQHITEKYKYQGYELLDKNNTKFDFSDGSYHGALLDKQSGHLNPLKFLCGLANTAKKLGVKIFENSTVNSIDIGLQNIATTRHGKVSSKYLILACGMGNKKFIPNFGRRVMPVNTYIIATDPLSSALAEKIIPHHLAFYDTNLVQRYFHRDFDNRIVMGGELSYFNTQLSVAKKSLQKKLLNIFPQLSATQITYAWRGQCDVTLNRMPEFGKIQNTVFFIHGLNGHGLSVSQIAAQAITNEITTSSQKNIFEIFSRIQHQDFKYNTLLQPFVRQTRLFYYNFLDSI